MDNDRPKICLFDLSYQDYKALDNAGFNVSSHTLGSLVRLSDDRHRREDLRVVPDYIIPPDLHEYDVTVVNLTEISNERYKSRFSNISDISGTQAFLYTSHYPETHFDCKPLGAEALGERLKGISRKHLVVAFANSYKSIRYTPTVVTQNGDKKFDPIIRSNFSFLEYPHIKDEKIGSSIKFLNFWPELDNLLKRHQQEITYAQTFKRPTRYDDATRKQVAKEGFFPVLLNLDNEIISYYCEVSSNMSVLMLPQVPAVGEFLVSFFSDIAPARFANLFPSNTQSLWLNEQPYWLPNHRELLDRQENLIKEFNANLEQIDSEIESNQEEYGFLHDLITETDSNLVKAVKIFFEWLEFSDVRDMDELSDESNNLEEDIQVDHSDGLLVIEVKGIFGTSKDAECGQIGKIKHRRCKERNSFDVFGLYIVNHQRNLPPEQRQNPPFQNHQVTDAQNEERGLLTTWQLFRLYSDINLGCITKDEAREALTEYGFVDFYPNDAVDLGSPEKLYSENKICIITLNDIEISTGDILIAKTGKNFSNVTIKNIQFNDKDVDSIKNGKVGIELTSEISEKTQLWKRL